MGYRITSVALKRSITPVGVKMDERMINTGTNYSLVWFGYTVHILRRWFISCKRDFGLSRVPVQKSGPAQDADRPQPSFHGVWSYCFSNACPRRHDVILILDWAGISQWSLYAGRLQYKSRGRMACFPPLAFNFTTNAFLFRWGLYLLVALMQRFSMEYSEETYAQSFKVITISLKAS